jgi:hypothetical protein
VKTASVLLLLWYTVHYGYGWAAPEYRGVVFNILRSAGSLVLIGIIVLALPTRMTLLAGAGMAGEELQVVGCGTWWLISPWVVREGEDLCSEGLGLPLGSIGLVLIGMLAAYLWNRMGGGNARPAP